MHKLIIKSFKISEKKFFTVTCSNTIFLSSLTSDWKSSKSVIEGAKLLNSAAMVGVSMWTEMCESIDANVYLIIAISILYMIFTFRFYKF